MFTVWLRTLQLSIKSLLMHPLRSSLTVLGIFIGVSSVIWLLALGEGISRAAQEQISSLGALNIIVRTVKPPAEQIEDAPYGLTRKDYTRLLATVPTIEKAIPMRVLPALEFRNKTRKMEGRLVGTTPDYAEVTRLTVDRGRFITDADIVQERNYCVLAYEVKPEYDRFVALAGADENLVEVNHGSNLARYPSVVFKVLVDAKEEAASPVMRILSPAWRFDVPIPRGAKTISLVVMDAGDGSREDFADWANAGFILRR